MARVKSNDTSPERAVRSLLHSLGFRFRLHRSDLPGKPDIVLSGCRAAVFVHGCFWHGHMGCSRNRRPSSNTTYWDRKLDGNKARDERNLLALSELGWRTLVIWQCEVREPAPLANKLRRFLSRRSPPST